MLECTGGSDSSASVRRLRRRRRPSTGHRQPRPTPARALSEKERDKVFDTLCSERFVDRAPAEVVATLLDEDVYLCSERTMYRVLASQVPVRERRAQRSHPEYQKPELMATGPGEPPPVDLSRAGSAKLGALDRSQGRSGVSPFGARLASPLPALEPPDGLPTRPLTPTGRVRAPERALPAATPPSAASRAPPRPRDTVIGGRDRQPRIDTVKGARPTGLTANRVGQGPSIPRMRFLILAAALACTASPSARASPAGTP